ncbi:LrgB family protein [Thalassobaculum sp.]|uniref:LrgB family protein n=1 Tax=Thalassobaculum sp. TaxID=2022740 RepID=UPI0032EBA98D
MKPVDELWVYLATNPLLHLTLTLVAYLIGNRLYRRFGMNPLLNPVVIAIVILVGLLVATGTSYERYFEGAQFVHFLLGPATVALAVPLYNQFARVRRSAGPLLAAIVMGSLSASLSAVGISFLLGAAPEIVASIAPKSVTTPIAMGIAEQLGGLPSLTAVLVILTGVVGAMLGPPLLTLLRIRDWRARGLAIGVAAHGIGTARAMQVNEVAGAFSGLAMGLNALATAILLPLLWSWIF